MVGSISDAVLVLTQQRDREARVRSRCDSPKFVPRPTTELIESSKPEGCVWHCEIIYSGVLVIASQGLRLRRPEGFGVI